MAPKNTFTPTPAPDPDSRSRDSSDGSSSTGNTPWRVCRMASKARHFCSDAQRDHTLALALLQLSFHKFTHLHPRATHRVCREKEAFGSWAHSNPPEQPLRPLE